MKKATNEQVITAYQQTGSAWKAAKLLGMCGQSVWERLKRLGVAMPGTTWSDDEKREAVDLAKGGCTLGEIANRLGRPYSGVAGMLSDLGVRVRVRRQRRTSRKALATPWNAMNWMLQLQAASVPISQFCRTHGLDIDTVVATLQQHQSAFWEQYVRAHAVAPPRECAYCHTPFYPLSHKQAACSRRCQAHHRVNHRYFGGNRQNAVGLADGICQLCRRPSQSLHVHHEIGKQHDPGNEHLIALCSGCHQLVERLANLSVVENEGFWERLILLANTRRFGMWPEEQLGLGVTVDIDLLTDEDIEAMAS